MSDDPKKPYLPPIIGTDLLGRPFTDTERKRFEVVLRQHDYPGARLVGLRFAFKLRRTVPGAQDLMGHADLRLVRQGWDPNLVPLVNRLCRLVWSEWTNEASETAAPRKVEEMFLKEMDLELGKTAPSPENTAAFLQTRFDASAYARTQLDRLRAAFEAAHDEVNLLWLKCSLEEITDPGEMAKLSGRDVTEFYRATDLRKRHVMRLIAADRGDKVEETN